MAVLQGAGYSQTLSVLLTEPVATSVPSGFHAMHRRLLFRSARLLCRQGCPLTCANPPPATSLDLNMVDCEGSQSMTETCLLTGSAGDVGPEPLWCQGDDDDGQRLDKVQTECHAPHLPTKTNLHCKYEQGRTSQTCTTHQNN